MTDNSALLGPEAVISYLMPKGVEHRTLNLIVNAVLPVISYLMPKGVEHTIVTYLLSTLEK